MVGPKAVTATDLAAEVGIHQTTLSRWLRDAGTVEGVKSALPSSPEELEKPRMPKRPKDWTPAEKWAVVIEAENLPEEQLGALLRRKGLHETQLRQWRTLMFSGLQNPATRSPVPTSSEARRIRELEKELDRKDKALAETAALLVLQKKVHALWGDEAGSTPKKNGR